MTNTAPPDAHAHAEARILGLLRDSGLPTPDEVQHGTGLIRLLWHDKKVAVEVDISDFATPTEANT